MPEEEQRMEQLPSSPAAERNKQAIAEVLDSGVRTGDIMSEGSRQVGTTEMGDVILAAFTRLSA